MVKALNNVDFHTFGSQTIQIFMEKFYIINLLNHPNPFYVLTPPTSPLRGGFYSPPLEGGFRRVKEVIKGVINSLANF